MEKQVDEINQLFDLVQRIVYFNVVTPILTSMYTRLLENQLRKLNVDLLEFDTTADLSELDQYNPNIALRKINRKYGSQLDKLELPSEHDDNSHNQTKKTAFEEDFDQFIDQFGHLSSNTPNIFPVFHPRLCPLTIWFCRWSGNLIVQSSITSGFFSQNVLLHIIFALVPFTAPAGNSRVRGSSPPHLPSRSSSAQKR